MVRNYFFILIIHHNFLLFFTILNKKIDIYLYKTNNVYINKYLWMNKIILIYYHFKMH